MPLKIDSIERPDEAARSTLKTSVKAQLEQLIACARPGDPLPTYGELAETCKCSLDPVRRAMVDLHREGRISLQRGRPAKVAWNNGFSENARRAGHDVKTRAVELSYRPLQAGEQSVGAEFELDPDDPCLVCFRVRSVDGTPLSLQKTYINPLFFSPERFFLDHDVVTGSLSQVYIAAGLHPLRVSAMLRVDEANALEQSLLELPSGSPILRSVQRTVVEHRTGPKVLEIMHAAYRREITYAVERLPILGKAGGSP